MEAPPCFFHRIMDFHQDDCHCMAADWRGMEAPPYYTKNPPDMPGDRFTRLSCCGKSGVPLPEQLQHVLRELIGLGHCRHACLEQDLVAGTGDGLKRNIHVADATFG